MTPEQKIKWAILVKSQQATGMYVKCPIYEGNVDKLYDEIADQDVLYEFRGGEVETGLKSHHYRHYECYEVASQMPDGSWVGWTYWYGGGKHGEPEEMPWMNRAYELDLKEEEKLVVVRTWSKK